MSDGIIGSIDQYGFVYIGEQKFVPEEHLTEAKARIAELEKELGPTPTGKQRRWQLWHEKWSEIYVRFRGLVESCEWYANNGTEQERHHFLAVEARGNFLELDSTVEPK